MILDFNTLFSIYKVYIRYIYIKKSISGYQKTNYNLPTKYLTYIIFTSNCIISRADASHLVCFHCFTDPVTGSFMNNLQPLMN